MSVVSGRTTLFYATKANHVTCIRELLRHGDCPVDKADMFQACPLLHAASHGNQHIVLALLEKNANIDGPERAPETPATLAAFLGLLWSTNICVCRERACVRSALTFKRCVVGDFELLKLLVERGASLKRVNANGENVEEVLQSIHRLSLRDAQNLQLDEIVKVTIGQTCWLQVRVPLTQSRFVFHCASLRIQMFSEWHA